MPTSSDTVISLTMRRSVSTTPTRRDRRSGVYEAMSLPISSMTPETGREKPDSVRSRVDLPAPLGPSRQVSSPDRSEASMSRFTVLSPWCVR